MKICPDCGKSFKSLGFARHRAMHRDLERKEWQFSDKKRDLQKAANLLKKWGYNSVANEVQNIRDSLTL